MKISAKTATERQLLFSVVFHSILRQVPV